MDRVPSSAPRRSARRSRSRRAGRSCSRAPSIGLAGHVSPERASTTSPSSRAAGTRAPSSERLVGRDRCGRTIRGILRLQRARDPRRARRIEAISELLPGRLARVSSFAARQVCSQKCWPQLTSSTVSSGSCESTWIASGYTRTRSSTEPSVCGKKRVSRRTGNSTTGRAGPNESGVESSGVCGMMGIGGSGLAMSASQRGIMSRA